MGGGKKKRTLTQMAKAQESRQRETKRLKMERERRLSRSESKAARIIPPDPRDKNVIKQLQNMKVITPYTVASRFNLLLSVAKDFLEDLYRQGVITYVSGGRNLKIYKPSER
ncbi:hypothetical protein J7L97_02475 [Candidatus Bathyarchaeota archaeon]|nr:hypothetical protein [Candidatus Bathyarchaeota archaeon]